MTINEVLNLVDAVTTPNSAAVTATRPNGGNGQSASTYRDALSRTLNHRQTDRTATNADDSPDSAPADAVP